MTVSVFSANLTMFGWVELSRQPVNGHVPRHLHPNQILEKDVAAKAANYGHFQRNLYPNQTLEMDGADKVANKRTSNESTYVQIKPWRGMELSRRLINGLV
jgi:hypothetical protein